MRFPKLWYSLRHYTDAGVLIEVHRDRFWVPLWLFLTK